MPKSKHEVALIAVSDIHLQHRPPLARCGEKDWYAAMKRPLQHIGDMAAFYGCPVAVAGDIFDKWSAGPETINFALTNLPRCYAVAGNHDCPHHRYEDINRSAYWTLVEAGRVIDIPPGECREDRGVRLWGFPWGSTIKPLKDKSGLQLDVALIHSYLWMKGTGYPGAPENTKLSAYRERIRGYDCALFGDNHTPCWWNLDRAKEGPAVVNCGSLMRRTSDQEDYQPRMWLIRMDGTVEAEDIDVSRDVFTDTTDLKDCVIHGLDAAEFLHELAQLRDEGINFPERVRRLMDVSSVPDAVRKIILTSLGET